MTTEPKFVPNEAIEIHLKDNASLKVRLIDCVGYLVRGALGYQEMNFLGWFPPHGPMSLSL